MAVDLIPKETELNISDQECQEIYNKLYKIWQDNLEVFDVRMPQQGSAMAYWLIALYKHKEQALHKDTISRFTQSKIPNAGQDQQVRHLGGQHGWYVINTRERIPQEDQTLPSGYHCLYDPYMAKPTYILQMHKRKGRIAAENWEQLKASYHNKCATCGCEEGKPHRYFPDLKVTLQQGHMNPNKKLTLENTIPQCMLCNSYYLNKYSFDEYGRIKHTEKE